MYNNKMIIVSFTTWKPRISDVAKTIYMLERQTLIPDIIILNLSEEEFIHKEKDLPDDLMLLLTMLDNIKLNWVKENTKAFKKVIPTIENYYNTDCWILSVDDDYFYNANYVKFMVDTAEANPNMFLTPGIAGKHIHGWCAIYTPTFFKDKNLFKIKKCDCDKIVSSDLWITLNLLNNGIKPKIVKNIKRYYLPLEEKVPLHKIYKKIPLHDRYATCYEVFRKIGLETKRY